LEKNLLICMAGKETIRKGRLSVTALTKFVDIKLCRVVSASPSDL